MCNTCQMNRNTCVYQNNGFCDGLFNTLFGRTSQSICRDCCGNVRTNGCYQHSGCYVPCCRQNCCCGCNGCCNNGTTGNNGNSANNGTGNSGFACVTYCGNTANTSTSQTQTTATNGSIDWYYARQYGLYPRQNGCCRCGGASAYNSFMNVAD